MDTELKEALGTLEQKLQGANQVEIKAAVEAQKKSIQEALDAKMAEYMSSEKENYAELKQAYEKAEVEAKALEQRLNEIETKAMKGKNFISGNAVPDFKSEFKNLLSEKHGEIKKLSKGNAKTFELKDVEIKASMLLSTNLTGDAVKTYQDGIAAVPSQLVNVADLVPNVQSATGLYVIYREGTRTGAVAAQTEGADKAELEYNITEVVFNASYLAGYVRISKQMLQDLPFMSSFLPNALRRDYFKSENSTFYAAIKAAATASTATGTTAIERIIQDIGQLETADYQVNGVVLNPADWATIAITKPSDFSLPQVVTYINGQLVINGIPVFKASWVPAGEYIVGDWSYAKKVITDGLSVNFYEQDQDNVIKNLVTVKVEARVVLGIDRGDAFITGTVAAT